MRGIIPGAGGFGGTRVKFIPVCRSDERIARMVAAGEKDQANKESARYF